MAQPVPDIPVAGWYPDPDGQGALRYWDGSRWTHRLLPQPHLVKSAANRPESVAELAAPSVTSPPTSRVAGSFAWALAPLVTLGFAASPCFIYAAFRLRSRLLGLAAAGYAALSVLVVWGGGTNNENSWQANIGSVALVVLVGGSTGHAFALRRSLFLGGRRKVESAIDRANERLRLRDDSRKIAETNPRLARELQIGRPDLRPEHDDGGLIDVNHVPVEILSGIDAIGPDLAAQIVDARRQVGAFQSRDDLEVTVGIDPRVLDGIADALLFCR